MKYNFPSKEIQQQFLIRDNADKSANPDLVKSDDGKVNDPIAKRTGTAHYSQGRILPLKKYDPDQPRDDRGRFGSGSGGSDSSANSSLGIGANGSPTAHNGKESYREKYGIQDRVGKVNYRDLKVDKERATRISEAYDELPSNDPAAYRAYDALADEVSQQYDYMTNELGIKVEFVDYDPYETARDMFNDVEQNSTLKVLSTASTGSHSYLSDETNDKFRAVHDYFGHAATGRGFMQDGEEAAWVSHSSMFTDLASAALTTETRGQNSWYNNHDSGFAEQKTAILPQEFIDVTLTGYKSAKALLASLNKYDENQPRDERGRFGSGGGGTDSGSTNTGTASRDTMSKDRASFEANVHPAIRELLVKNGIDPTDKIAAQEFLISNNTQAIVALQDAYMETDDTLEAGMLAEYFANNELYQANTYYDNEREWITFQNNFMNVSDSLISPQTPQTIIDSLNNVSENGQVCIAIDPQTLNEVLEDGRFQNQFETDTSNGILDQELRETDEFRTQGVPIGTPDSEHPIYGYLISDTEGRDTSLDSEFLNLQQTQRDYESTDEELTQEQEQNLNLVQAKIAMEGITSVSNTGVDQYGSVRVVLNDSVNEKATLTLGDSLTTLANGKFAVPMGTPVTESIAVQQGLARAVDDPFSIGYVEAQVHGGVSVSNIEAIYAPADEITGIELTLQEKGLTIPVYEIPKDK
jgi:hypothetical protein